MSTLLTVVAIVLLTLGLKGQDNMEQALNRIAAEVEELRDVNESAIALIAGLAEEIRNANGNEERLNALADSLDSESNRLAAAVAANTEEEAPVEPEIPTEEVEN